MEQFKKLQEGMFAPLNALQNHWYVLCFERDVPRRKPRAFMLWDKPIVLWRSGTAVIAMLDRCPHRDVPLSKGRVDRDHLICPYHGWEFAADGQCAYAPALGRERCPPKHRAALTLPVHVRDGLVWVWPGESAAAAGASLEPPPRLGQAEGMLLHYRTQAFDAAAIDVIENFVDAPHTPILHRGLVRGQQEPLKRRVVVRTDARSVTVTHAAAAEKVGIAQRLINPEGAPVRHRDRFELPAVVRVDYQFGSDERAFSAFIFCTPINARQTLAHIVLGLKFGWITPLLRLLVPAVARRVLRQDAKLLRDLQRNLQHFPERSCGFLASDLMHVQAQALWRAALENRPSPAPGEREVELFV